VKLLPSATLTTVVLSAFAIVYVLESELGLWFASPAKL
jgi:hypothetical protein